MGDCKIKTSVDKGMNGNMKALCLGGAGKICRESVYDILQCSDYNKITVADVSEGAGLAVVAWLDDHRVYFMKVDVYDREKTVNLGAAQLIVAAGAGAADPNTLGLVRKLANTIGAELGASRPLVDSGLLGHDHQVGQTGTTVRPNLYIACGISGQIQHRAGMAESQRIIAINSDPDAPIFNIAHYGIVGNLNEVIPKMINAYKDKA